MDLWTKIGFAKSIIQVILFSRRIPLIVSWHLINRCSRSCIYCSRWKTATGEMENNEILGVIDELAKMGTRVIIFSGGEPLLRDNIGEIISYCRSKGIFTGLTSNGDLVERKINEIKELNVLKLSLDGPEEIHDFLRGKGSFDKVMEAVEAAKKVGIPVKFNTTLTRYNIGCIDFLLAKAEELDIQIKFQPVSHVHAPDRDISDLLPEANKYQETISRLIYLKKRNPYIINSTSALKYLYALPKGKKINCYAGRIICCIMPDGRVAPCSAIRDSFYSVSCLSVRFKDAFDKLPPVYSCKGCWCTSTLELNCFLRFDLDTFLNMKNMFK
ncbi:MAG: radical SAM protein [Candidatus Omnitrophota bacterium]